MLELWQTEWCPASRRVRERLTELGVDYVSKQVPVERAQRTQLAAATGTDAIPVLTLTDGECVRGEQDILDYLQRAFEEPAGATAHRAKAAKARARYLREECECQAITR